MKVLVTTLPLVLVVSTALAQDVPRVRRPAPTVMLVPLALEYLAVDLGAPRSREALQAPPNALTSIDDGVTFDLDGDGEPERVPWTAREADIAFLALDVDGDGRITSGKELFGSGMRPEPSSGADALIRTFADTGAPLSGSVEQGHALYERLLLWIDRNHNGISEPSELRLARELFTAIGLGFTYINWMDDHGHRYWLRGWLEVRTGGPDQGRPDDQESRRRRVRHFFEVSLNTR
jgi:hypothetical protein